MDGRYFLRAGLVPFKSADGGRLNDEAFLRLLAHGSAPLQPKGKAQRPGGGALADLPLTANDVVKVRYDLDQDEQGLSQDCRDVCSGPAHGAADVLSAVS